MASNNLHCHWNNGFKQLALSLEQWLQTTCIVTGTMASNNLHCHWNNGFNLKIALLLTASKTLVVLRICVITVDNGFMKKKTLCL